MHEESIAIPRDIATKLLRESLGDNFLVYLLNLPSVNYLEDALEQLPLDRFSKLTQLMVLATPILLNNPDFSTVPGTFCRSFEAQIPFLDEFRNQNGASIYIPPSTDDKLYDHLAENAQRIFPTLLMKEWGNGLNTGVKFDRLENYFQDDLDEFKFLLYQEECITNLLHSYKTHSSKDTPLENLCISTRIMPIFPLSITGFKKAILCDAFYRANTLDIVSGRETVNLAVKKSLNNFRALMSCGESEAIFITVFESVKFIDNSSVNLDEGELRVATDYEKQMLLPKGLDHSLIYVTKFKDEILRIGEFENILESTNDNIFQSFLEYKQSDEILSWFEEISNNAITIQASIILANVKVEQKTANFCGRCILIPYGFINSSFRISSEEFTPFGKEQPLEIESQELKKWFELLKKSNIPIITLRRLVTAFSERQSSEDAILDLLIALESLFGSSIEINFKLSLCIAKILNPTDETARRQTYNKMRDAYTFRSKTVHGERINSKKYNAEEILAFLCDVTTRLIKALLTEKSDLLEIQQDKRINAIALS